MTAITPFQAALPEARIPEAAPKPSKTDNDTAQIKQLAEEFESLFLGIVLKSMRDTEYSKQMARQRSTGLANNIEDFLLKAYGAESKPPSLPTEAKAAALSVYERASRLK
jgi:Rod binding domain-containing protein